MADDLDQLLDEVERRFCGKVSVSAAAPGGSGEDQRTEKHKEEERKGSFTESKLSAHCSSDNLDAFLDKLLKEDSRDFTLTKTETFPKGATAVKKVSGHCGGRKCCPVFVGGSSVQCGIGTATSRRSCDQLRCTSCDFNVLMFDDCEWDSSCDYLFFRNNMPERPKLQSNLRRSRGIRAYCCQCSWASVSELTELKLMLTPPLRWVCAGKHQD